MVKHQLCCCALCQLTANNNTSKEEITKHIDRLKEEAKEWWNLADIYSGERACFVIVTPDEKPLEQRLIELNFKEITQFDRRNGYPAGKLKMYFLNW